MPSTTTFVTPDDPSKHRSDANPAGQQCDKGSMIDAVLNHHTCRALITAPDTASRAQLSPRVCIAPTQSQIAVPRRIMTLAVQILVRPAYFPRKPMDTTP